MSSLVMVRGKTRLTDQQKRDLVQQHGVGLIKLKHAEMCAQGKNERSTHGFRSVTLLGKVKAGRKVTATQWSTDEQGQPCANHHLVFQGDEFDIGYAYLPDDPDGFNRRKLAYAKLGPVKLWDIVDPVIDAEVARLAEEIRKTDEYKAGKARIEQIQIENRRLHEEKAIKGDAGINTPLLSENAVLEHRIAEMEAKKKNKELKAKYEQLLKEASENPEPIAQPEQDDSGLGILEIRKQCKELVHEEQSVRLAELKIKYPKGWHLSKEYQEDIQPLIDKKINERLAKRGHSGTGDDD